jgi:hypothetical protein
MKLATKKAAAKKNAPAPAPTKQVTPAKQETPAVTAPAKQEPPKEVTPPWLSSEEFSKLPSETVVLTDWPKGPGVLAGVFGCHITAVGESMVLDNQKVPVVHVIFHHARANKAPEPWRLLCRAEYIQCPQSGVAVRVRLATPSEAKAHEERRKRDEGVLDARLNTVPRPAAPAEAPKVEAAPTGKPATQAPSNTVAPKGGRSAEEMQKAVLNADRLQSGSGPVKSLVISGKKVVPQHKAS